VVGAGIQQVDDRIYCEAVGSDDDRARGDTGDGVFGREIRREDSSAQGGVGEDQELRAVADEDRGRVVLGHDQRRGADRDVAAAEQRRPRDQLLDPQRCELRQGVNRMTRLGETLA